MEKELVQLISNEKEIEKGSIIGVDNEWLVAVEMNQWSKWSKQKIEQKIKTKLEKVVSNENLIFASDFKLLYEANELIKKKQSIKTVKEKFDYLRKLMKEET